MRTLNQHPPRLELGVDFRQRHHSIHVESSLVLRQVRRWIVHGPRLQLSYTNASAAFKGANWSPVGSAQQYQGSVR